MRGELPPLRQFPWWDAITPPNLFWKRPAIAPNGKPWPRGSEYIEGYAKTNVAGGASVVIDNSGSLDDVFVKLYYRDHNPMVPARVALVRAKAKFTFKQVQPGHYDVRYLDLTTGVIKQSMPIEVTEQRGWVVGLYGVREGTQHHREIRERDFSQ